MSVSQALRTHWPSGGSEYINKISSSAAVLLSRLYNSFCSFTLRKIIWANLVLRWLVGEKLKSVLTGCCALLSSAVRNKWTTLTIFLSYCKYRPQSSIFAAVWFWEGFFGFVFVFTELIGHRLFQLEIISFLLRDTSFSELNLLNLFQCKAKPIRSLHPKVKGWDLLHTSLCSQNQWDPEGLLCWLIFFFIKQAMVSDRWSVGIQCVVHELLCLAKEGM